MGRIVAMEFVKMHGLGNDFVVVREPFDAESSFIRLLCDRRRGIGADGVLSVGLEGELVTMGYWNADGSEAEMCGNGLRCVARFAADAGLASGPTFTVRTPAGVRAVRLEDDGTVMAEIGVVAIGDRREIDGHEFTIASVGNPHAVTLVDDPDGIDVAGIGARIEHDPSFPHGTNVEFVSSTDRGIRLRVWERGVGETLACGTGMVAAAAVMREPGADDVEVSVPGGVASVRFVGEQAWLRGPVATVFSGVWKD
jgi:diaminopimelate epimerase